MINLDTVRIDALIATQVMDFHEVKVSEDRGDLLVRTSAGSFAHYTPTKDMALAWEVLAKLCETQQITLQSLRHPDRTGCAGWHVTISGNDFYDVIAMTAPRAICMAALRLYDIEIPRLQEGHAHNGTHA